VTVEARATTGGTTADVAENRHVGSTGGITIKKAVNAVNPLNPTPAEEADTPSGPTLAAGTTVTWTYRVSTTSGDAARRPRPRRQRHAVARKRRLHAGLRVGRRNANGLLDAGEVWLLRRARDRGSRRLRQHRHRHGAGGSAHRRLRQGPSLRLDRHPQSSSSPTAWTRTALRACRRPSARR
jgi:hypothetical protein